MNQNQELSQLLMRLMEAMASTIASCVRVLRDGPDASPMPPEAPHRPTNAQLLVSDLGLLNMTVAAIVQHVGNRREPQQ